MTKKAYPIKFERLFPGTKFRIAAEPSRGIRRSTDRTIYVKAKEEEGFYSVSTEDANKSIVLMPYDLVHPLPKGE